MPSRETLQKAFDRLVARFEQEMQDAGLITPDVQMGINPPRPSELDDVSRWDGTAGIDHRPNFIREEDERTGIKWHGII